MRLNSSHPNFGLILISNLPSVSKNKFLAKSSPLCQTSILYVTWSRFRSVKVSKKRICILAEVISPTVISDGDNCVRTVTSMSPNDIGGA